MFWIVFSACVQSKPSRRSSGRGSAMGTPRSVGTAGEADAVATLKEQLSESQATIEELRAKVTSLSQSAASEETLRARLKATSEELALSSRAGAAARKEATEWRVRAATLKAQLAKRDAAAEDEGDAAAKLAAVEKELESARAAAAEAAAQAKTEAATAATAAANELAQVKSSNSRLQREVDRLTKVIAKHSESEGSRQAELDAQRATAEELATLRADVEDANRRAQEAASALLVSSEVVSDLRRQLADTKGELAQREDELKTVRSQQAATAAERSKESSASPASAELEAAKQLIAELRVKQDGLQRELDEAKSAAAAAAADYKAQLAKEVQAALDRASSDAASHATSETNAAAGRERALRKQLEAAKKARADAEKAREADAERSRRTMDSAQAAVNAGETEIRQLRDDVSSLKQRLEAANREAEARARAEHGASGEVVKLRRELKESKLKAVALESELGRSQEQLGDIQDKEKALREEVESLREAAGETETTLQEMMAHKDEQLAKVTAKLSRLVANGESFVDGRSEWRREMESMKAGAEEMRKRLLARAEAAEQAIRTKLPQLTEQLNAALAAKADAERRAKRAEERASGVQRTLKQSKRDIELLQMKVAVKVPKGGPGASARGLSSSTSPRAGLGLGASRPQHYGGPEDASSTTYALPREGSKSSIPLPKLARDEVGSASLASRRGLSWKPRDRPTVV